MAQYLVRELVAEGYDVYGGTLDGEPPELHGLAPEQRRYATWLPLDVTSDESIAAALRTARPNVVFHLAAQSSVRGSFADPISTWSINATGTLRLLERVRLDVPTNPVVLLVSSAEVYGVVPAARQPIAETATLRPITPYGASKAAAEMAAVQVAAAGLRVVIARSFNHTGPGQDERFALASFGRQLREMGTTPDPVLRVGNLTARRDFLDVRDVVRAYVLLAERGESGTAYNVCSGRAWSLAEVVETMAERSRTGARIDVDPERVRPVDTPLLLGDPARLHALGWTPQIPLRETLADLVSGGEWPAAEREA